MSELLTSSRLSCRNCNLIFTTECHASGCSHNGIWHDKYSDCNIKCAMKLGWGQLGRSHYSCCYAVDKGAVCEATAHCFDIMEEGAKSSSPDHGPITASDCPRYVVNLDAPPGERWSHIVVDYLDKLPGVLQALDEILGTGVLAGIASSVMTGLTKVGRFYYGEEIEGISRITGIPVGKLALLQIAYEVFAACTSIVVNMGGEKIPGMDDPKVSPFHIRTMDWDMSILQPLTIEADFVKGGVTLFRATTWVGYVGILTGMRTGVGSVSVNYRRTEAGDRDMVRGVIRNMVEGLKSSWPVSFLVREALTQRNTYEDLVGALKTSELMAPTYIIVAGTLPSEGCVITRERRDSVSIWDMSMHGSVVQTNMDHFNIERGGDCDWQDICYSRYRHNVVRAALASLGDPAAHYIDRTGDKSSSRETSGAPAVSRCIPRRPLESTKHFALLSSRHCIHRCDASSVWLICN